MSMRTLPLALTLTAAVALTGCDTGNPDLDPTLMTSYGHVVDSRGWAVGARMDLDVSVTAPGRTLVIGYQSDDGAVINTDGLGAYGYGEDIGIGAPSPWDLMPGNSSSYTYGSAVVEEPGEFDLVITTGRGKELSRTPLVAAEPDGYALGVVLDDCPEFPDLVFKDQPTLLEESWVMVAPAPVDANGDQLVGHFDFTTTSSGLDVEDWGGGYVDMTVGGSDFDISFTIAGETYDFPVKTASADEIVSLEIADIPEKHGMTNESLLCAVGRTADGRVVHGISADWGQGWNTPTIHAENFATVDACFGSLCATWNGPDAGEAIQ